MNTLGCEKTHSSLTGDNEFYPKKDRIACHRSGYEEQAEQTAKYRRTMFLTVCHLVFM